jgi:hypothetical protein
MFQEIGAVSLDRFVRRFRPGGVGSVSISDEDFFECDRDAGRDL